MLSNEWMGAFCLAVVWLNGLLIAAHVWQTMRTLVRARRALGDVVRARVVDTRGAAGIATVHVAQVGRAITEDGPSRILLTEASRRSEVHAGIVEVAGSEVELVPLGDARVWCLDGASRRDDDFERAFSEASTSRGYKTEVDVPVGATGSVAWIGGAREGAVLRAAFVSDRDPSAVVRSAAIRSVSFIVLSVLCLVGISMLALVRPWFTGLSTVGGMLAVAYFLSVQPIANALRESIAVPEARRIGGIWQRA